MKNLSPIALVALLLTIPAHSEPLAWPNQLVTDNGPRPAETVKQELSGSLLAVTDQDWKKKWATPPELKPSFNIAQAVSYGTKVFMLIFFSNPGQDQQLNSMVGCDLKIIDPTGVAIVDKQDMNCFSGQLASSPTNQYLSAPVISFVGEPGDPPGTWTIEVKLRDAIRRTELPLRTSFELIKPPTDQLVEKPSDNPGVPPAPTEPQRPLGTPTEQSSDDQPVAAVQASVTPTPLAKQPTSETDNWAVNLIAYKQLPLAQRTAEEFAGKGIPAKVSEVDAKGEIWYRLSVDGFASQQQARDYAARAKNTLHLDSVWINKTQN